MHTEAGAAMLQRPARQGFPPSEARGRAGGNLRQAWRPESGSGYSGAGETSPRGAEPKGVKKMEEGSWGETLTSSKIQKSTRDRSQVGGEQTSVQTAASAKGKGSRGLPCPSPAFPQTHAHARAPSVPGSGKVRDSKTATLHTNHAARVRNSNRRMRPQLY